MIFVTVGKILWLCNLTWNPPVMDSLNQTCFFSLMFLLRYQFFMGTLVWLGWTQVSPVSMLQWTLMASRGEPWLGSTQYVPVTEGHKTVLG